MTNRNKRHGHVWAALLRGVNLGARNKVAMADLRRLLTDLGTEGVTTYLQSGNAVFRSTRPRPELAEAIEQEIEAGLGVRTRVLLRTASELAGLVAANPFAARERDPGKLHATFLAERPAADRVRALEGQSFSPDAFRVTAGAVLLHCPRGYGRSKLGNAFLERALGVPATTRNWRTVLALVDLARDAA